MKVIGMAVVVASISLASATGVRAADRREFPTFALSAADGTSVESSTLAVQATWLFVYVQAHCAPCDTLLGRIGSDERKSAARIVVVGAGMDAQAMTALAARHPNLRESRWLADPDRAAVTPLGVQAMPTVFGLRGLSVEWRLAGTVRNNKELDSILFTWLEKR